MRLRIYPTKRYDLETVAQLLHNADSQANFHPEARWILASSYGEDVGAVPEQRVMYKEFFVKWIGREAVVMWLVSNQILFKINSYKLLPEEAESLEARHDNEYLTPNEIN
tara:strand:- start:1108 stop:1437 length:330 start_codon:yes stop_codon:yes gene_type:complete